MEKSKLPVLRSQAAGGPDLKPVLYRASELKSPNIPCCISISGIALPGNAISQSLQDFALPSAKKPCPPKPVVPFYSRDPNIAFSSAPPNGGVFKAGGAGHKPVMSKKTAPPIRGPINRYRMESERKYKNQLLETTNSSLQNNLMNAQNTIQQMSEQQESLKEELTVLQRRVEKNMIILESRNIDPGEQIIAAAEETSKVKEETKVFTENLLKELKVFTRATKEQKELVQTVKAKWDEAEESRNEFLKEQEAFQRDLEQFQLSLECAEKLLDL